MMATILDTLKKIPMLQAEIEQELESSGSLDSDFLRDLMSFTSVYYFDLLAHACMDALHKQINTLQASAFQKYFELLSQDKMLHEYIRWQNIGGLFSVWAMFERFILRQHGQISGKNPGDIQTAHKNVLDRKGFKRKHTKEILQLFTGIRRTRNTLHESGIYSNGDGRSFHFEILGETFTLEPNKPVKPIRLLSVIQVMWDHYKEIKQSKDSAHQNESE
jgi:hypothetical protein